MKMETRKVCRERSSRFLGGILGMCRLLDKCFLGDELGRISWFRKQLCFLVFIENLAKIKSLGHRAEFTF
jgi:hypothetical protein